MAVVKDVVTRARWNWFDKLMAFGLCLGVSMFLLSDTIGTWEGRMFPVVEHFTFEAVPGDTARGKGTMDIVRDGCVKPEVEAYLGRRRAPIEIVFEEGVKARDGGSQEWGPWRFVGLDPDLADKITIEVMHSCPLRPWRTRTVLKP